MSRHFKIHHFDSIDSTQFEARKNIYGPGDIILSDIQTGGYGRRGREWQSPPGNLYCTLVEAFPDFSHLSWLGYAVGLALYEAVQPLLKQG
ncbi:MAG: biotin--acetyl-CoA-carboxylase ligase, partial [Alphaproteobacteria bacterium]|nr:biotin--acetyl-CoA-carboxylase ligase [Alphaproteobacteria bacterium]